MGDTDGFDSHERATLFRDATTVLRPSGTLPLVIAVPMMRQRLAAGRAAPAKRRTCS